MKQITILCVNKNSNYWKLQSRYNLDIWDIHRDAYNYSGSNPVITHSPCQQWSRLHRFANDNPLEKNLAFHCYELVNMYGGIFEHPSGSHFFKEVNANYNNIISINQSWFGFEAVKKTLLYSNKVKFLPHPLNFNCSTKKVANMGHVARSQQPIDLCIWLIESILTSL